MPGTATIQSYNDLFQKELNRLNDAQRTAVDQIEGPVLVIAGPGTGKTHILTARIGRILTETDTQPHNILCLTFTDAGVHAMRERLLEFIGPEAHRVHIFTFHSFCNSIIQDNLELFGRHDLEPLSDLERVEIIRKMIEDLDIQHPMKKGRADIYFYEEHLSDLFKRMKAEHWTSEYVSDKIDEYLESLPDRKEFVYQVNRGEFRKGDLKMAKVNDEIERMERLRAAAQLFPLFIDWMRQYRRYDFEDMILWVLQAFQNNTALLRTYQEQYLYFLIDEFQDTNGAQNEIVQQLIEYWENPNIFIVGDDDQSIYEFQGARLKNLTDFYQDYRSHLKLVLLKQNYRSSQNILDTSNALIQKNEKRIVHNLKELGIQKILEAQHAEFAKVKIQPQILEYPNRIQEEVDIVNQIEALYKNGFPLQEVAIIYAKHKQVRNIIALLTKKNIPYHTRRKVNILDLRLIQNLRMLLEYFQAETTKPYSGEHLLFKILHLNFLHIHPQDLAKLTVYLAKFKWQERPAWRDVLGNEEILNKLQLKNKKSILQFYELLNYLLTQIANLSIPAFLERLINRSGLLQYVIGHYDKIWLLQVLHSFVAFIQKETDRRPRLQLSKLLDIFKNMDANRLSIQIQKTIYSEEGVHLLTAHSSKGLEFQKVFLLDCIKDNWEPRSRRSGNRFPFPETLTFSGEEDALEARRRLFYVAITRAKETLHLSYSNQDNNGKGLERTAFIDEIIDTATFSIQKKELPAAQLVEAQTLLLLESEFKIPLENAEILNSLLEGFTLSVSSMNKYLRCPLNFYYENVLKVPVVASDAANYGTAMHNALQRGFEKMLLSKRKIFPAAAEFVRLFEHEMHKLYGSFSKTEYDRRMEMGKLYLLEYVQQYSPTWPKKVRVEMNFKNVELEGVPITGTIDRLEFKDNSIAHIVDYKTGSQSGSKLSRPTKANKIGGNYWRQLIFYKILYENYRSATHEIKSAEISYLQPNAQGEYISKNIEIRAEDVKTVKQLIIETWQKIQAHEFQEGCGEKHCNWCTFVQQQGMIDSFSEAEIEELDDRN